MERDAMESKVINYVGVVGAGVMGAGVAQNLAATGHRVVLVDVSPAALERAQTEIRNGLRFQRLWQKEPQAEPAATVLARLQPATDLTALAAVDFVIENVPEKWHVKREVYARLDEVCREDAPIAANTSAIPITRIGALSRHPQRVLGMHFMNPVPQKPAVEMIRGHHTSEATLAAAHQLLRQMGKEGIVVNDSPGFVSNRVLMLTINEAIFLVQEKVATPEQIDQLFRSCFGHPMGPLATADLIGLDTILDSIVVLHDAFGDSKYRACPLLQKMVDAGLLGRKNGKGFFDYSGAAPSPSSLPASPTSPTSPPSPAPGHAQPQP
jgi:3-hydroxybutyryl-CoA dehydrogenase